MYVCRCFLCMYNVCIPCWRIILKEHCTLQVVLSFIWMATPHQVSVHTRANLFQDLSNQIIKMTSFQYIFFFSDVKVLRCLKHTTWQKRILLLCKESLWSQGLFPATHLTGFRRTPLCISLQRECDNRSSLSYHGPDAFLRLESLLMS